MPHHDPQTFCFRTGNNLMSLENHTLGLSAVTLITAAAEYVFEKRVVVVGSNYVPNKVMTSIDPELGYPRVSPHLLLSTTG
jgi:hypothetical protein